MCYTASELHAESYSEFMVGTPGWYQNPLKSVPKNLKQKPIAVETETGNENEEFVPEELEVIIPN